VALSTRTSVHAMNASSGKSVYNLNALCASSCTLLSLKSLFVG
jgi:hypothetical protein